MSTYKSKKGTTITIPDGLSAKQIADIKADADAGYGTRAQQTANSLAKTASGGSSGGAVPTADGSFSTDGRSPAELQDMLKRTQAEIDKRGGADKAPGYANRLQQIQSALNSGQQQLPPSASLPGTVADPSGYQPGPEPTPAYPDIPFKDPGGGVSKGTVDTKSGTVDPVKASDDISKSETHDVNTNFQLEHPQLITDQNGNSREITRHADGTVTVKDTKGGTAQTFTDLATAAASSFNGAADRASAEAATYGTLTKYYDRDKARDLENSKQELAQRGIPYSPDTVYDENTKDLYGKTLGAINQRYQGLKDTASQQAVLSGNQAYATTSSARDSFLNAAANGATTFGGNFGPYSNSTTTDTSAQTEDAIKLSSAEYATKYGVDISKAIADKADATSRYAINNKGAGGGGSGSSGGSSGDSGFNLVS